MKEEIEVDTTETVSVVYCDSCGREATNRLVPLETILDEFAKVESRLVESLEKVDAPDIPPAKFERRFQSSPGRKLAPLGYTTTLYSGPMTSKMNVVERHYDGIDADERELIEKAEKLQAEQSKLIGAVAAARGAIESLASGPYVSEPVDLCDGCFDLKFGWD